MFHTSGNTGLPTGQRHTLAGAHRALLTSLLPRLSNHTLGLFSHHIILQAVPCLAMSSHIPLFLPLSCQPGELFFILQDPLGMPLADG